MTEIHLAPEPADWDAYVTGHTSGIFSHLHGWGGVLASTYRLPLFRLAARETGRRGRIVGVLPLILFALPDSDKRLISLPYTDAAGILADDQDISRRLLTAALELAFDLGADHLELRQAGDAAFSDPWPVGIHHRPHSFKVGLSRELPSSSDILWGRLDAKVRNQVRKARKGGCSARIGGDELAGDFYAVFSENMRDLGSPVHSFGLFAGLLEKLSARLIVIFVEETPVAAAMVFRHGATLFNPWASSLRRCRPLCPNMLLYWTMLAHAADTGCRRFDFGRSTPGAATCRFKLQWGAGMQPLVWHVFSRGLSRWDPRSESLENDAWRRMDLAASRGQGPAVRRWISL